MNKAPPVFRTGDSVKITADGRTVEATVLIASGNSVSLMLAFEAILHGHAGMMPVLWENDEYFTLIGGHTVEVKHV